MVGVFLTYHFYAGPLVLVSPHSSPRRLAYPFQATSAMFAIQPCILLHKPSAISLRRTLITAAVPCSPALCDAAHQYLQSC